MFQVDLQSPAAAPELIVEKGNARTASAIPSYLGLSETYLAVASALFSIGWQAPDADQLRHQVYFEMAFDLDVFEDQLVVLAIRKGEKGTSDTLPFDENGAYLWLADLSASGDRSESFRPLAFSASGARAKAMDPCGLFAPGAVRFAPDGSFFVVPQAEHGAQHYSPQGRLLRTWESADIGIDSGCQLNEEEWVRFAADVEARQAWVNGRRVVEDIAFVDGRPALLVRERRDGTTRWQLNVLGERGVRHAARVPIESASGRARLRLDQAGKRLVFLLSARENPMNQQRNVVDRKNDRPQLPARIAVATIQTTKGDRE